jgi:peptidyl-prolyl cis-trans isomerase D
MAVIQTIRNRAGLLVAIIIGMALLAFILGDILTSGSKLMNKSRTNVAFVNGKGISIDIFQRMISEQEELMKMQMGVNTLDEQTQQDIRQRTWDDMIQTSVMDRELDKLGLSVSSEELFDMVNGENPHPYIMQFFADPKTGILNRSALSQFLQNVNELEEGNTQKMFWLYLEDLIYKERETAKYNTLIRQGLYTTNLEANRRRNEMNTSVNFSYIAKRYNEIPDSLVDVTDADVKAYYKEHKNEFKQQKSRDVRYVVWEVVPSKKDYAKAESWIKDVKKEFETIDVENTIQYAKANSDIPPNTTNYAKGELDSTLDAFAFSAEPGAVYGPYFEDNYYKLAKLSAVNYLPDSVKASHILFTADKNSDVAAIQSLADSLVKLIKKGANFAELAIKNSTDQASAQEGGSLGWIKEGEMVKPFSDSCFFGKTGDIKLVYSQYGLHIVKIEAQSKPIKKVQVGILAHEVRPSEETDQTYFAKASEFGAVNNSKTKFNQAISEGKAVALSALNLKENDNGISNLTQSRQLVRWAYTAKEGDVTSTVLQFDNKYVVALLDKVREEGYAPIEDVKGAIEVEVRKQKQAEQLIAKLNEAKADVSDINTLANKLSVPVKTATNIRFTSYSIPNLGVEPKLEAIAVNMEQGQLSSPIDGNNGVYVIQIDSKETPKESTQNTAEKNFLNRSYSTKVYSSMKVLNELAGIEDNRISFF